jgi:hypothetical protein
MIFGLCRKGRGPSLCSRANHCEARRKGYSTEDEKVLDGFSSPSDFLSQVPNLSVFPFHILHFLGLSKRS